MICILCKQPVDTEHPTETVRVPNPITFRIAWMHIFCFEEELGQSEYEEASSSEYYNRQDEYLTRFS